MERIEPRINRMQQCHVRSLNQFEKLCWIEFLCSFRFIGMCWRTESRSCETRTNWVYHYWIRSGYISSTLGLFTHRKLSSYVSNHSWTYLCCWTLRSSGAFASLLPSCQTVSSNRYHLFDAHFIGKLLLALHVSIRACEYDFGLRGNQIICLVSNWRFSQSQREYGADDYVSKSRNSRG